MSHELDRGSLPNPELDRRDLLKTVGGVGAGMGALSTVPGTVAADDEEIDITTVNSEEYPTICTRVQVDTAAGRNGDLTRESFDITENGENREITSFDSLVETGGAIDVGFVFDDTLSMDDEISALKDKVTDFADTLESEGFDARYGLVSFKDDYEVDQPLTSDVSTFQTAVDNLSAVGGDDSAEDNFDAIEAALDFDYRSDAQRVIIDITDAGAHFDGDGDGYTNWTLSSMTERLQREGLTYIAVSPGSDRLFEGESKQTLAENVGGTWIDIASADFSTILDQISEDLTTAQYILYFETPLPCADEERTVVVTADDPERGTIEASRVYRPPECDDIIDITRVDPSDYSCVCTQVQVDTAAGRSGDLTVENFDVAENGEDQEIKDFRRVSEEGGLIDVAFVFDDTGSMSEEISGLKSKVSDFASTLEGADLDARYGLVSFKDDHEVDQTLTSDLSTFQTAVDSLTAEGGDDAEEDNFDAIDAALNFDFRADAQPVIIDITDATAHFDGDGSGFTDLSFAEISNRLLSSGATYIAVSPGEEEALGTGLSKQELAREVSGTWIDIESADFEAILEEISVELTTAQYVVCYDSPLPCNEEGRGVTVTVDDPERGGLRTSSEYVPPECDDPIDIPGIDPGGYSCVCTRVQVDTPAGREGDLTVENFDIAENGENREIKDFEPVSEEGGQVDVSFVFDDSGSMGPEIDALKNKVSDFAATLESGGFDARYGLVSFRDEVDVDQELTGDLSTFQTAVDNLSTTPGAGGDAAEDNWDAIDEALNFSYRPDAQKVVIDITDATAHFADDGSGFTDLTSADIESRLLSEGATYIAVSPGDGEAAGDGESKQVLAENVDGRWIDIDSADFTEILEDISIDLVTGQYIVCFDSPLPCNEERRSVTATVEDPDFGTITASGSYIPPRCDEPVDIPGIDPDDYPELCTRVQVDTPAGRGGDLTVEDFDVAEEGEDREIIDFQSVAEEGGEIDVAFVFDDTGSMAGEISATKTKVNDFADTLESAGFDARYSLVSFKDDFEVDQTFTSDVATFQSSVNALTASGGGDSPEDDFDAIEAALNLSYRDGAQKVIIDITDATAHYRGDSSGVTGWTLSSMAARLQREGATYIAVTPGEDEAAGDGQSKQVLANEVGGTWIDINSEEDFGVILEEIVVDLTTGQYVVCFESPFECESERRSVEVTVEDPDEGRIQASGTYIPPECEEPVDIPGIDPDDYPTVYPTVQVDTEAGRNGDLTVENFDLDENGEDREITDFTPLVDGGGELDIAFVFDDTGSMGGEISALKTKVNDFANTIESAGFDARYGLVSFKDNVEVDQTFTSSVSTFQSSVNALTASAGGDFSEDNFDAIEAALTLDYRTGAQEVIIDITDATAHFDGDGSGVTDFTLSEIANILLEEGITYIAVSPGRLALGEDYSGVAKQTLAEEAGGRWVDINSEDFETILEEISVDLSTGLYELCYESPIPCDDERRTVTVTVDDPGQGELVTSREYVPPVCGDGDDGEGDLFEVSRDAPATASAGSTVEVETTVELLGNEPRVSILERFSPPFEVADLTDAEVDGSGEVRIAAPRSDAVVAVFDDTAAGSVLTITYEVTIPEDAEEGATWSITGTASGDASDEEATIPESVIEVGEPESPLARYANEDGEIDTSGLQEAVRDWSRGEISTRLLQEVVAAWSSGERVV